MAATNYMFFFFFFINALAFTIAKEPSCPACSRYEYEEKLLERVLRNEMALENTLKEIKETNAKVTSGLADLEENRMTLVSALDKARNDVKTIVDDFRREINILQSRALVLTVHFQARTPPTDRVMKAGEVIVFTRVQINTGHGYDPISGNFTAPVTGFYEFSVQYCIKVSNWVIIEIVQEGKPLQNSGHFGGQEPEATCVTMKAFSTVAIGDRVWVRCTYPSYFFEDSGFRHSTFSGALVHA